MQSKSNILCSDSTTSLDVPAEVRREQGWTELRVQHLLRMWRDGDSASQIATALGGVSRNAVVGKLHRMGQNNRMAKAAPKMPPRIRSLRVVSSQEEPDTSVSRAKPLSPAREAGPAPSPAPGGVRAGKQFPVELRDGCRWIEGDPRRGGEMCGQQQAPGSAYCSEHHARCYQRATAAPRPPREHGGPKNNRLYSADVRVARALLHIGGGML